VPPAGGSKACPAGATTLTATTSVTLAGSAVTVKSVADCAKEEITFTVSGKSGGWLAFGLAESPDMAGTDTYQVRIVGGKAEVRNGHAEGYQIVEDAIISGATGELTGGELSVTFTRPFAAAGANDFSLSAATAYFINVAKHDTLTDFTKKHTNRASGKEKFNFIQAPAAEFDCKACFDSSGLLDVGDKGEQLWCDCCANDCDGLQPSCIKEGLCVDQCVVESKAFCDQFGVGGTTKKVTTRRATTAATTTEAADAGAQSLVLAIVALVLAISVLLF
jgi:hypothetical protein